MVNEWARNEVARFSEAAQHMREVAIREGNPLLAEQYSAIAERYEQAAHQMLVFAEEPFVEPWQERN